MREGCDTRNGVNNPCGEQGYNILVRIVGVTAK